MTDSATTVPAGGGGAGVTPEGGKLKWYRRRSSIVAAIVAAIVAVTVVTDLPQHASRPAQISSDTTMLRNVNADVAPCAYAVGEAFTIYRDKVAAKLSPSDSASVPSMLRDDQAACSFTDESIFNLSNIEVTGSVAGKHLQELVSTVTLWATSDGLAAIEAVQSLVSHPGSGTAQRELAKAETRLKDDRSRALAEVSAANAELATRLPVLELPSPVSA